MYTIYEIISPSGKMYVGLTSLKLRDRWDAHCTKAFRKKRNHPFYCAIRKYGKAAFRLAVLETTADLDAAKLAEMRWIAERGSTDRRIGYNISPGGDYDSETGKISMRKLREDPVFDAAYRAALSVGIRARRNPESYKTIIEAAKQWRADNPRQSYENGRRAVRIATRAQGREWNGVPDRLPNTIATWGRLPIRSEKVQAARRSYFTKKHVRNKWASIDDQQRSDLSRRISEGQKASFAANPNRRAAAAEQLKSARAAVDRKKQGVAASKGLKNWWAELKADPERYAAYLENRNATLKNTLQKKSNLRCGKRGAEE